MSDDSMDESRGSPIYCIECGNEIPEGASFCPDCGAEVNVGTESKKESSQREREHPDPEKVADKAEGSINPKILSQTRIPKSFLSGARSEGDVMLFENPLITYIRPDEQLQYILKHPSSGFRIFEPNGDERTPHHSHGSHGGGYRFLLVTDTRLLYVAAYDGEDIVREFDYSEIESIRGGGSAITAPKIRFQTKDGTEYRFAHEGKPLPQINLISASQYIETKIE